MTIEWPGDKKFAFAIVDDTDNGTVSNLKPVYDLLFESGLRTTKTVWVYPPRDSFTGECLLDKPYQEFVKELSRRGFEIALHNVGSGSFTREEIQRGVEFFHEILGFYPTMHINHASNPDNLYWGAERYTRIFSGLIRLVYGKRRAYYGTDSSSGYFWGGVSKKHFKYIRNHTFNGINTLRYDPEMPYRVKDKDRYSNYWFSSSDGHTVEEFNNLVSEANVDKLEHDGGACIVYTHFAANFVNDGRLNKEFAGNIKYLASRDGWFVPASTLLDYLLSQKEKEKHFASNRYLMGLDVKWIVDRIIKKLRYRR